MTPRIAMALFTLGALFFAQATADDTDWKPPSMPVAFCARLNTSPSGANFSDWQTEGLCAGFCRGNFALAVVQNKACWCTDYIPDQSSQVDSGQCNGKCPGYPWDVCGTDSLFAYLALDKKPAGTANAIGNKGPASTTTTTTTTTPAAQTTSNSPVTIAFTSVTTSSKVIESPTTIRTSTAEGSSPSSSVSSSTTSSTTSPTPTPEVHTVTAEGTVRTVTVTPTAAPTDAASSSLISPTSQGGGLSTGATAGIAVGVIAVVGAFVALGVWMWCVRRKRNAEHLDVGSARGSSPGLTATPRTPGGMSEGPAMSETWEGGSQNGRRRSTLMPVDPRLDPFARGMYNLPNKSHESFSSLQDNQDYSRRVHQPSRVLRATNPDPEV